MTPDRRQYVTLGIRVTTFVLAMGILGAFWLPWVSIDGFEETSRGVDLLALMASPQVRYLTAASPLSAAFLIVGPLGVFVFAVFVGMRYVQRRTTIPATSVLLAFAVTLPFGASGLLAQGEPGFHAGLVWIVASTAVLLLQQVLIKVSTNLQSKRKFPQIYRALAVFTGSAIYRWREG